MSLSPNSIAAGPTTCNLSRRSIYVAANHVGVVVTNDIKRLSFAMGAVSSAILMLLVWTGLGQAAESDTQGKTVVFVPGVMGNAFYVTMERGIRAEAAKYGFSVDIQGAQQFDPTLQTPIVNAVVASKPAALIVASTDSKALFVPISQAVDAGIKVALVDTTLISNNDPSKAAAEVESTLTAHPEFGGYLRNE